MLMCCLSFFMHVCVSCLYVCMCTYVLTDAANLYPKSTIIQATSDSLARKKCGASLGACIYLLLQPSNVFGQISTSEFVCEYNYMYDRHIRQMKIKA